MTPATVTLPLQMTADMLRAVRQHPTTCTDDKEEEHRRIGWLLCAWDVLTEMRMQQQDPGPEQGPHLEHCTKKLQAAGKPCPRTCAECGLGPCRA